MNKNTNWAKTNEKNCEERRAERKQFVDAICAHFPKEANVCIATINAVKKYHQDHYRVSDLPAAVNRLPDNVNCYISLNPVLPDKSKNDANISHICGIYVDIDLLHQTSKAIRSETATKEQYERWSHRDEYIADVLRLIDTFIMQKAIPHPTMIIKTGCGIALHFRYPEAISVLTPLALSDYRKMYLLIIQKFRDLFANVPAEYELEVDSVVGNLSRTARIPGTRNLRSDDFASIHRFLPLEYQPDVLYALFHLDDVHLDKKSSKKSLRSARTKENFHSEDVISYVPEDVKPEVPYPVLCTSTFLLKCMDTYFDHQVWVEGSHREKFCFAYYSLAKIVHGAKAAYRMIRDLNDKMEEPLSKYQLNSAVMHIDNSKNGCFTFSPRSLISEEWLDLSESEAEEYGFLDTEKKKKQQQLRRDVKWLRDCLIKDISYCGFSSTSREVADMVNELLSLVPSAKIDCPEEACTAAACTHATVLNVQKRLGIAVGADTRDAPPPRDPAQVLDEILNLLQTGENVFLYGKAGTGKSYAIQEYIRSLPPERVLKVSATGFAAYHINGSTIHSLFHLHLGTYGPHDVPAFDDLKLLESVDVIIIDEISTLRFDIFAYIVRFIQLAEVTFHKHIQLIVVGDFKQLAPVLTDEERNILTEKWNRKITSGYAFEAVDEWKSCHFTSIELTQIVRQKDLALLTNINRVRDGDVTCLEYFNQLVDTDCCYSEEAIHLCNTHREIDDVNAHIISQHVSDPSFTVFEAEDTDKKEENLFPVRFKQPVYVNMRVMTTQNNLKEGYTNGSIGTIEKVNTKSIRVRLDNGDRITLGKSTIYAIESNDTIEQLPIIPAYAVTTYKAQGQSFDKVIVHPNAWDYAQSYVALSRCTRAEGLKLAYPIRACDISKSNGAVDRFYTYIKSRKL